MDRIAATQRPRQKENGFLNVRRQIQQVQDLADPRAADVAQHRKVRMIADRAYPQQTIEPNGQGH